MKNAAMILAAAASAAVAQQTLTIDVTGITSNDAFLSGLNTVLNFNIGAGAEVLEIAWDLTLESPTPSWLSEAQAVFTDSAVTAGVIISPAAGDDFPGTDSYVGSVDLVAEALNFTVGADGNLRVEFAESFVDFAGTPDSRYVSGTYTVTYIPTPGVAALAGLAGVAGLRRRR